MAGGPAGPRGARGSRRWELRPGRRPHAVVTDAAAPGAIAAGEVDAVLVAADRISANGDVIGLTVGAYPLALAAAAAGVPFVVLRDDHGVDLGAGTPPPPPSRTAARARS